MLFEEFTFKNQFVQSLNEMRGNDHNCTEQLLKYLTQSVSMFNAWQLNTCLAYKQQQMLTLSNLKW